MHLDYNSHRAWSGGSRSQRQSAVLLWLDPGEVPGGLSRRNSQLVSPYRDSLAPGPLTAATGESRHGQIECRAPRLQGVDEVLSTATDRRVNLTSSWELAAFTTRRIIGVHKTGYRSSSLRHRPDGHGFQKAIPSTPDKRIGVDGVSVAILRSGRLAVDLLRPGRWNLRHSN